MGPKSETAWKTAARMAALAEDADNSERLDQLEGARGETVSYGDTKHHQSHHIAH